MDNVYIVSCARTAIGSYGGSLRNTKASKLCASVIKEVVQRANIQPSLLDEVIMGEVRQSSEATNIARVAALLAGVPEEVPAYTVHRNCASSMQALQNGYQQIIAGDAGAVVVGGAENMSRSPYYIRNGRFGEKALEMVDSSLEGGPNSQPVEIYGADLSMGMTAENVAQKYGVSREEQDEFALHSQTRAAQALREGKFKEEIVPVELENKSGIKIFACDETIRPETTLAVLGKLKPAFKKDGTVTAGNSCGRSDGAAAMILMSGKQVQALSIKPLAKVVGVATTGVSPKYMGMGPVTAVKKLLAKTDLKLGEIDLIELNEAFAAQVLAVSKELGLGMEKTNVNGGGIALGHPMGATGVRLLTTLYYELARRQQRYGLATLCIGGGQGMATIIERL